MDKKKKIILLTALGILMIGCAIALYFILKPKTTTASITQNSLSTSDQSVDLGNTELTASNPYLYTVSTSVLLEKVENFVSTLSSKFESSAAEEGVYYEWTKGDDIVSYELDQGYLIFNFSSGIAWDESDITGYTFREFVTKYFGKTWNYALLDSTKMSTGERVYYANRSLDDINVETILDKQETDYLAFKNGKIIYGKILLTDFEKTSEQLTLIDQTTLEQYINLTSYPKEIYPQYSALKSTVLSQIDYKSEDFAKVLDTLTNCKSQSATLVYLYKLMDQGNLTPVYKLELQCEITYKDTVYTIPAIGYVNAVDPELISSGD